MALRPDDPNDGATTPERVSLLRLRLRFGAPSHVPLGTSFRVAIDLVDEMAQSPPTPTHCSRDSEQLPLVLSLVSTVDSASNSVLSSVPTLRLRTRVVALSRASVPFRWCVDCVVEAVADGADDDVASLPVDSWPCRLRVAWTAASAHATPMHPTALALQRFCLGSQWRTPATLVLPVVSDAIRVVAVGSALTTAGPRRSRCLRVFALPLPLALAPIVIEEDYGHAMGAHVWDASIWLSLALLTDAPTLLSSLTTTTSTATTTSVALWELGAGCGLVACVTARLLSQPSSVSVVATELCDALSLLRANVARNGVADCVELRELLWGTSLASVSSLTPRPVVILAADVLYHWSAHEPLLATLEALCRGAETAVDVVVAHKRRGVATAQRLDDVLATGIDQQCATAKTSSSTTTGTTTSPNDHDEGCAFARWRVERLANVAYDVDLLRLTLR